MDQQDLTDVMHSLRLKAFEIEDLVRKDEERKLEKWSKEVPEVKNYIAALSDARNLMRKELDRLQAEQKAKIAASLKKKAAAAKEEAAPGIPLGFNSIRSVSGPGGEPLHESELHAELERKAKALTAIDASIEAARAQLANPKKAGEREVWETNVVILQDTRRMHAEEAGAIQMELEGRERMRLEAEERARAEESGAVAAAGMAQQIAFTEGRLDALKQRLYFPPVKGYSFAQGSNGIYFGAKDFLLSEVSGNFSISAGMVPNKGKGGDDQKSARLSIRVGCPSATVKPSTESQPGKGSKGSAFLRRGTTAATGKGAVGANGESAPQPPNTVSIKDDNMSSATDCGTDFIPPPTSTPPPKIQNVQPAQSTPAGMPGKRLFSRNLDDLQPAETAGTAPSSPAAAARLGSDREATSSGCIPALPTAQSMARDAMLPKATSGKRMALGFLSKIGAKEKYTKRLARLEATAAERAVAARNPPVRPDAAIGSQQEGVQRKGLAARLLPKRGTESRLMFGSHRLGSRRHESHKSMRAPEQASLPEEAAEEEPWQEEAPAELPKYVFAGANPHSCSSKSRTLAQASSIDSDKLLFQSPFGGKHPPATSPTLNRPQVDQQLEDPPPPAHRPNILAELSDERDTNPFLAMMAEQSGAAAAAQDPVEATAEGADQAYSEGASVIFVDDSAEARDDDDDDGDERDSWRDDTLDDESVQEIELDPSMGHLIAGSFSSGADTLCVNAAPAPKPAKPVAESKGKGASTDRSSEAQDAASMSGVSSRSGMWIVVQCSGVGLFGERGSKVPSASIGELTLEIEVSLALDFEYSSATGWRSGGKPKFEIKELRRTLKDSNIPMPKTLLRLILNATLPRLIHRGLLTALPPELGQYLLESAQELHVAGEVAIVGPAISALDADVCAAPDPSATHKNAAEAKRAAQLRATAQEVRSMLGVTLEQAGLLASLFCGPEALVDPPRPCTISQLQAMYSRCANIPHAWEPLAAVWDTALRALGKFRGVPAPSFLSVMDNIANLLRKPVRARLVLTRVELAMGVDAALAAMRNYFERAARELHARGGRILPRNGAPPPSLQEQEEALAAWYTFLVTRLRVFKAKFRGAAVMLMAAADCGSLSLGVEQGHYEGPLRVRIPVRLSRAAAAEGVWSFEVPLPDPTSQKLLSRFIGGLKAALTTPPSMLRSPKKPVPIKQQIRGPSEIEGRRVSLAIRSGAAGALGTQPSTGLPSSDSAKSERMPQGQSLSSADNGKGADGQTDAPISLLDQPPAEWFGKSAGDSNGDAGQPTKLGKVLVNGLRVRVRLDEARLTELLRNATDAATSAGLLACLGDLATVSFDPHLSEEEGQEEYLLALESSEMANLRADVAAAGFVSGAAMSPGRLLRVAHALSRAILMTFSGTEEEVAQMDGQYEAVYEHLVREALDVSVCLEGSATLEGPSKDMVVRLQGGSEDTWPLSLTNDLDLATLFAEPQAPQPGSKPR
ncbi:g7268 [Coccomyxa elongata]